MTEERVETEIVLTVPSGYSAGDRLDRYIAGFVQNATRTKVQQAIREGRVSVNAEPQKRPSYPVSAGDVIVCKVLRAPPIRIEPEDIAIDIVYEDDAVIVVNKPAGMVVHPAHGHRSGTLVNALLHHVGSPAMEGAPADDDDEGEDPEDAVDEAGIAGLSRGGSPGPVGAVRPGIVHRLDKDTSGLMVVARDDVSHVRLARQFEQRTIHRTYLAVVWGNPPDAGEIDAPIGRSPRDRKKMAVVRGGKPALTRYEVVRRWPHAALVALKLETGRTHQIRVHMAHIGHPIMGDVTYGGAEIKSGPDTRHRRAFFRNVFERIPRQALHARDLEFVHPATGETVSFTSPLPDDLEWLIERLSADSRE